MSSGRCRPTSTADVWLGAHGIWKWSWAAAKDVTIRNTVFRLDQASYSSCSPQQWPAGSYQDVTLVWTGAGAYSTAGGCRNVLPAGVTLTTDRSVWDNARSAWLARSAPTTGSTSTMTPTRITARANGSRVSGTLARASGHRLSGKTLTLQRRTATSGWVKLTSRRTGDAGVARATVFPRRTTLYRWKYHGVRQLAPATSRAVRVSR